MSPPPLFRIGSRARFTSLGIALCTMFIVASFSIAGGLKVSMDRLESTFASDLVLVTKPGPSGPAAFDPSEATAINRTCAYGAFVDVEVNGTVRSTVFYLNDSGRIFDSWTAVEGSEVLQSSGTSYAGLLTLSTDAASQEVSVAGRYALKQFPDGWLQGSPEVVGVLIAQPGAANFAIFEGLSEAEGEALESEGFVAQAMTGIIDFLGQSVGQIQDDIALILVPSSFVIAVLSYGFIGSETADRRHDIGILKTIGAGRSRILSLLLTNAFLISLWGGLLGLAFGIVLSYAISTAASTLFTSVFVMSIDPTVLALALASTVAAGLVGALVPSFRMTTSSPVSDLREGSR